MLTLDFEHYLARLSDEGPKTVFTDFVPLGRLGTPDEYASLAVYLAADGHDLIGQISSPNGGAAI